jgi:ketosteroid isomerase-like protein
MSEENVEIVRRGLERFLESGEFVAELATDDFTWDMSNYHGWPEQQVYEGIEGARAFLADWIDAWDDWKLEVESLHDAGDKVLVLVSQHGTSKAAGMPVEMHFAQVFTIREGAQSRIEIYSDRDEAFAAVGLSGSAERS